MMRRARIFLVLFLLLAGLLSTSVRAQGPTPPTPESPYGTVSPVQYPDAPALFTGTAEGVVAGQPDVTARTGGVLATWELKATSPAATMDNVVAWAIHDGGLWSIGGYGSGGATQRYDPASDTWTTYAVEPSPQIEYPVDGCYGLDYYGHEVVVLFPDTTGSVVGSVHVYDITQDSWGTWGIPGAFPVNGLWAIDVVSMYNITGENVCYISGGASTPGGGDQTDLWEYHPDTNAIANLGNFTHIPAGFDFHASWYVPWIGQAGAICVGGGVDAGSVIYDDTQCYRIAEMSFGSPNADLGLLPEPWWGMADGWKYDEGRYQIWIANGADLMGNLLQASAYLDSTLYGFVYGPTPVEALYRLEGDDYLFDLYVEQGAAGGFNYTTYNQHLLQPPKPPCTPEVVFFEDFEGDYIPWVMTGLWNGEAMTDTCGAMHAPFPSPDTAAYYGQDNICTYDTGAANSGELTYYDFLDLTYYVTASLSFWSYEETECGAGNCYYDQRFVEVSPDFGATWHTVWASTGPEGTWYQTQANLTPYAGRLILLRFRFDTIDNVANDYFGWLVDDVTIVGCHSCAQRWHPETPIPDYRSDPVVLEYDGRLFVFGGAGSAGSSYVYYPGWNAWFSLATMSPEIAYPRDGAIGDTPDGFRAFLLDDMTSGVPGAMIYDFSTGSWIHDPVFPVPGRWAPDMARDTDRNLIYITGGATTPMPGVGDLSEFWIYDPWTDSAVQEPDFDTERDFHASWYVPWLGEEGYLCIAGGVNSTGELDSTQCYDLATGAWRPENADLGTLPVPLAGMGDATKVHDGCPQLWVMGGKTGVEIMTHTLYLDICDMQWHWGQDMPFRMFRSEADAVPQYGEIYQIGGSSGGVYNLHHLQPCPQRGVLIGNVADYETGCGDATCRAASVVATSWAERRDYAIPVDAAGQYTATLPVGAYSVTASAWNYAPDGPYDLDIAPNVVVQDFCLQRPEVGVAPAVLSVTSYFSIPLTLPLAITNSGSATLTYTLVELLPTMTLAMHQGAGIRPAGWGEEGQPVGADSATAPEGYVPSFSTSRFEGGLPLAGTVCIFKDADSWGTTAVETILAANAIPYEVHTSAEFGSLDFSAYGMIVFSGDQPQSFYDNYGPYVAKFEDYVWRGGFLNFFSCDAGWNGGLLNDPLPGGMAWDSLFYEDYNVVDDPAHPVMAGVPDPFTGTFASHGHFSNLPGNGHIIASEQLGGQPTIVEYRLGAGWFIAFGQPLEFGWANGQDSGIILENTLLWGYDYVPPDVPWVWEDPITGTVPASGTEMVDVTFHCDVGDGVGLLTATLQVWSNDPCSPAASVLLLFDCLGECEPLTAADFIWAPLTPTAGQVVTFTAAASGSPPISYEWDFGDGGSGSGAEATYTYMADGTYHVVLTATNPCDQATVAYDVVVVPGTFEIYLPLVYKSYDL